MTSYILSLTVASLAAVLVELLAPKGENGRLGAGVRMVAGLFLLVALLTPLRAGVDFLSDLAEGDGVDLPAYDAPDYESTLQASVLSLGHAELTAWVKQTLATEFSISAESAEVVVIFAEADTLTPPPAVVYIVLSGTAMLEDPHPIEAYFEERLSCPCHVSVAF